MSCKSDASQCIAVLSPAQSCCHGLWFASMMLHSALLFCHLPILQPWFMVCKSDASRCIAILSPFQSCCRQEFVKLMHAGGTTLAYGPKQKTHGWQPIDRGHIGATLKAMMRQEQQSWLEDPATLSHSQSCCHCLWFASLMLYSALPFCHPANLVVMAHGLQV